MHSVMVNYQNTAIKAFHSGLVTMPLKSDKAPLCSGSWNYLKEDLISQNHIEKQKWEGAAGIGYIGGKNSKGLFCLDVDVKNDPGKTIATEYKKRLNDTEPEWMQKFLVETSVNGGFHFIGRCEQTIGNLDLAKHTDGKVILETRGQGGYFAGWPTPGYKVLQGSFDKIPQFEPEELEMMLILARELNRKPEPEHRKIPEYNHTPGLKPGVDYDNQTTQEAFLQQILQDGWKKAGQRGQKVYLCRPGKGKGTSATFNNPENPGKLYVFSSSSELPSQKGITPFSYLTYRDFGGDFSACAKSLSEKGFGEKTKQPIITKTGKTIETENAEIETEEQITEGLLDVWANGLPKGIEIGWSCLDELFSLVPWHLNVLTGIPSHGKSEILDAIMVKTAVNHGWKWFVYSPENYPVNIHTKKLAEKYLCMKLESYVKRDLVLKAAKFITEHFTFVKGEDSYNITTILDKYKTLGKEHNGLVLDPWNEISHYCPNGMSETEYIGRVLGQCRRFARNNKVSFWIVAHTTKMRKGEDGKFPIPNLYDISGSANWYNKADNGLVIYRNEGSTVDIHVQKVKFKAYGRPGVASLYYDNLSGEYRDNNEVSFNEGIVSG